MYSDLRRHETAYELGRLLAHEWPTRGALHPSAEWSLATAVTFAER
jgi:hypothetical protein